MVHYIMAETTAEYLVPDSFTAPANMLPRLSLGSTICPTHFAAVAVRSTLILEAAKSTISAQMYSFTDLASTAMKLFGPVLHMLNKIYEATQADGSSPSRSLEEACLVWGGSDDLFEPQGFGRQPPPGTARWKSAQEWLVLQKKLLGADLQSLQAVLVRLRCHGS